MQSPSTAKTYHFPLYGKRREARAVKPLNGAFLSVQSDTPGLEWPYGYIIAYGAPLVMIGALFGIGAGASLVDQNITLHAGDVFLLFLTNLVMDAIIGIFWTCGVEWRLNQYYFEKWGTDYNFADSRPRRRVLWMAPFMYILISMGNTFLVVIPAIEWPKKRYSYWIALFRALLKGFSTGGITGMFLGYTIPDWPLELPFLQMLVGGFQTMASCGITVGLAEAWNITDPGPAISFGGSA